jgi:hypothetical protein
MNKILSLKVLKIPRVFRFVLTTLKSNIVINFLVNKYLQGIEQVDPESMVTQEGKDEFQLYKQYDSAVNSLYW